MGAGPLGVPLAAAATSGGGRSAPTARTAVHLPSSALLSEGDTGAAVAAVQRRVGVDDDGIFGPITRAAVARFQQRWGLPVTGEVDARTWAALFHSRISFVSGGGRQVVTVSSTAVAPHAPARSPAAPRSAPAPAAAPPALGTARRHSHKPVGSGGTSAPAAAAPAPA